MIKITKNNELKPSKHQDMKLKWCTPGHASVIETVFHALPEDVKNNLDLNVMIDGSNDPDEKFKDMVSHHYPASYKKAVKWLNDGKSNYDTENYNRASYCLGIASHYISDNFSTPHYIKKESNKDHHDFEVANDDYTPKIEYLKEDLDTLMKKDIENAGNDWKEWKKKKNSSIPHQKADMGASAAYSAIKDLLS